MEKVMKKMGRYKGRGEELRGHGDWLIGGGEWSKGELEVVQRLCSTNLKTNSIPSKMAILTACLLEKMMNSVWDIEFEKMVYYIKENTHQEIDAQQKIRTWEISKSHLLRVENEP